MTLSGRRNIFRRRDQRISELENLAIGDETVNLIPNSLNPPIFTLDYHDPIILKETYAIQYPVY